MADSDKNIIITPNRGLSGQPEIYFGGSGGVPIRMKVLDDSFGTLSWEGSAGQLFSINNNLTSGSIFSVNDVSGIPSIEVNADGTVTFAPYGGNVGIGVTAPNTLLHVGGTASASGFSGPLLGNATTATTLATSRNFSLTGDVTASAVSFNGGGNVELTTAIAAGAIVNADINASAGIVDTKLATISTAGKVSNSATTATNANTANAIVARDGSGNFSAGTITAALTGTATNATQLGGTAAASWALLASPTFTGTPAAPTATAGTNTTQLATTAFVRGEISSLVGAAPTTLDTLNELATALGNDPNFATTITTALGNKAGTTGGGASGTWGISITGNAATATTASALGGTAAASWALLASPTFTGTPAAPTAAVGTNTTQLATTAFVQSEIVADTVTSFNGRTGSVQGVSAAVAGDGISVSGATGAVTITNTGVTRAVAGTGISVSANTGTVTITNSGALLTANTFSGLQTSASGFSGPLTGNVTGNASTATTLANTRNFSLTGDITASAVSFNGGGNVELTTAIAAGAIVNADINASAGIVDTKLATISTAGKVSNSATTATNANTASTIVSRDGSGNFSAGTVNATSVVATNGFQVGSGAINAQTAGYTLVASDNGKIITINSSSAVNLTVGTAAGVTGFSCTVIQLGTGQVTIAGSSTTLNSFSGLKMLGQYSGSSIVCYATNTFSVIGGLTS